MSVETTAFPAASAGPAATEPASNLPTHVVGIGASAGGLEALERLFERMPQQTGVAFVVIQHLSPDFKSLTDELLARRTTIPIHRVENGMLVERDAIYLIPPRKDMIIANGRLLLTDKDPAQFVALPIDRFFRSLAQDCGERAIGIVLSGTGSDGSRGIRDIHEAGGVVIAQTPESAKFDGMPNSAVKTGIVDFRFTPEQMPDALMRVIRHPLYQAPLPATDDEPVESGMNAVFRLLRDACGIDFSHYKPETVTRRTERRLLLNGSPGIDEYARRLAEDPDELNQLYRDLLIGVTRFFRDADAFARLEKQVLPELLEQVGKDEEFRVWVAGCATGEEAYSLAILVHECLERMKKSAPVKIFATDVHRASLDFASSGVYRESDLTDLPPERLERWFVRRADGLQISPEIRKSVVFAQHNLIKDAPFTKLNLVSCRNLLIYFQPAIQRKVLSLFHFALRTGGALLLGPSESPGELSDEFDAIDTRWKVYRKRRDVRLPHDVRISSGSSGLRARPAGLPVSGATGGGGDGSLQGAYDAILDEFMPPSLLLNEQRELLHAFAGASRFLQLKDGRFTPDVLDMIDPNLRTVLAGALPRAFKEMTPVQYKGLRITLPEGERLMNLTLKPVRNRRTSQGQVLLCFEEAGPPPVAAPAPEGDIGGLSRDHLSAVESELRYTRENLQAVIEELETSNEELQAGNEELVASNEELQSTNEELHSVNEELYTVNAEHQKKIAELTELTTDMENLLTCTEVHTIFLDRNLCIRKFTPQIARTFNFLPQDLGRRIDNFTYTLDHPSLLEDLRTVVERAQPLERSVRDRAGNWYLLRVLPYRAGLAIDGVVLTLVNINRLKEAEAEAWNKNQQLTAILRNTPNPIFIKDLQGRYLVADDAFKRQVGRDPVGMSDRDLFDAEFAGALAALDQRALREATVVEGEVKQTGSDGEHTLLSITFPLRDETSRIVAIGGVRTDVTALKRAEHQARQAVKQRDQFLAMLSHELRNPLAAILNATAVLERSGVAGLDTAEWFRVIERRARHMARLLDDLLDVARLTQDKLEVRKEVHDLGTTMNDALEEVRSWFEEREIELTVERPDTELFVNGDPSRLQQLQVNLLMNAVRYTPANGQVWYRVRREGERAVIRVRDTGVGLKPENLERVFDLFVQADAAPDRVRGGIGVGLTLVRRIVELHEGTVRAESAGPGKGSEFIVELPLTERPAARVPTPRSAVPAQGARHVLVVEDDTDIRESLQSVLALDGYDVRAAADGPSALEALESQLPDVALVDIGMPGMDGYELARRIRQRHPHGAPRLVALTGYGRPTDRQSAREAGFDDHLTKPIYPRDLERVLGGAADDAPAGAGASHEKHEKNRPAD